MQDTYIDVKSLNIEQLELLAKDIREKILEVVSNNGGHLSSNLGTVELILAMHYVFDSAQDPFIFDVSHQSYAHKLLCGRWDNFSTLRQFGGISGYTKPSESKRDYFIAGHSSTSISLAVGAAKAIKLKAENRLPVVLIGDGAMSAGMAYEALNELGDRKYPCVIILNDNEMSISKPIGALSKYLSQLMAGRAYQRFKGHVERLLEYMPDSAAYMAKRFEEGFRLITPGIFFEELGLEYIGVVNGHDIASLIDTLKVAKSMNKPVIVHAQTIKGKGYKFAEGQYSKWHGVSPFDLESGKSVSKSGEIKKTATKIFSENLMQLADKYNNVVGVTAAMPSGTGMDCLIEKYPDRFWDVAIAEQHAVTSMAAMAKEGFKPFVAIYSTFMQRAYDQLIHDACILNLPVVFAMDRAGIVGEDGETHQGAFDISFLNTIPNMTLLAPRCEKSMKSVMDFAYSYSSPCAFRYPRGSFILQNEYDTCEIKLGKGEILSIENNANIVLIGYGNGVGRANEVMNILRKNGILSSLVDLVFIKPLDNELLLELSKKYQKWYVFSDSSRLGGVGQILSSWLQENNIFNITVESFEYNDSFIQHGSTYLMEQHLGILPNQIAEKILKNN